MKHLYLSIPFPKKAVFIELNKTILQKYKPRYYLHYPITLYIDLEVEDDSDITYLKLALNRNNDFIIEPVGVFVDYQTMLSFYRTLRYYG